ncbi:Aminoglycoside phosphotransferase [Hyella patelloides LEGE 07179]|uniref:Aminoglycoside phosphotransferase n=1 Tax=Hyella patelloides LEGE 07179 TaxID=945734 RepID=A0A563VKW2_9CYAN|nr:phosphotransferase [Hyella patelloides]VEP12058.1 Aminoglycoside phosphotransferase [Hyella patelloides LEGE 07179]
MTNIKCIVRDRFNIIKDPKMPFLPEVICPIKVKKMFQQHLFLIIGKLQLVQIKVIRYKPQKRCLIEYSFQGENPLVLIGKIRAKGTDIKSYNLQKKLWHNGFDSNSHDGISVPEPIGIIPQWQMWLQKKVPGEVATVWLATEKGITVSQKVAHVAHKLHQTNIPCQRRHTMADELAILKQKLPQVLEDYPHWQPRIKTILEKCHILGINTPEYPACGIHRDFYFDQIIVDCDRFYLLDLDLYCEGNPSLDIGNFIAHITEYSLRTFSNIQALQDREIALEKEFIKLTKEKDNRAIAAYKTLTLVRHIYLSNQFSERRSFTEALLDLCEERLEPIKI